MGKALKIIGGGVGVLALAAGGTFLWARSAADAALHQPVEAHRVDFPIPFPLSDDEVAALRADASTPPADAAVASADDAVPADPAAEVAPPADPLAGVDLAALATARAVARGKHLVESRFVCIECHGADFGGGKMMDDPAMGTVMGPNLTTGQGSRTADYTAADWDRAVRHGIRHDGTASVMPADDFARMSDRELSDVVSYIRSMPPVDKEMPAVAPGPVLTMLLATGKLKPVAVDPEVIPDHQAAHPVEPPPVAPDAAYGQTIANVCTGCHGAGLAGGPILRGPPSWPPAANITPAGPIGQWTFDDFSKFLETGTRPDGSLVKEPMTLAVKYTKNLTETERQALWTYLQTVPSAPTPQ
jgi:mono/diheme cytochrome c family protein